MFSDNINMLKEVNKQLQVVLEDTLFKVCSNKFLTNRRKKREKMKKNFQNIMQQDNIKHLGEEIDKIQRRCKCKPNTR